MQRIKFAREHDSVAVIRLHMKLISLRISILLKLMFSFVTQSVQSSGIVIKNITVILISLFVLLFFYQFKHLQDCTVGLNHSRPSG